MYKTFCQKDSYLTVECNLSKERFVLCFNSQTLDEESTKATILFIVAGLIFANVYQHFKTVF